MIGLARTPRGDEKDAGVLGVGGGAIWVGRGAEPKLAWPGVIGAGFALPRDAGRRPAFQAVPALLLGRRTTVSRSGRTAFSQQPAASRAAGARNSKN